MSGPLYKFDHIIRRIWFPRESYLFFLNLNGTWIFLQNPLTRNLCDVYKGKKTKNELWKELFSPFGFLFKTWSQKKKQGWISELSERKEKLCQQRGSQEQELEEQSSAQKFELHRTCIKRTFLQNKTQELGVGGGGNWWFALCNVGEDDFSCTH